MWKNFRIQAKQDLISCRTLYNHQDYGNSAYLLQQALEKFVKAYLFKFELFVGSPHKLRHYPIIVMWNVLTDNISRKVKSCKKEDRELFEQSLVLLNLIKKFFKKIDDRDDKRWKIGVWKYSLNESLNSSETKMITQIKNDMQEQVIPLAQKAYDLFSSRLKLLYENTSKDSQKRQFEELVQNLTDMSVNELIYGKNPPQFNWNYVSEKTEKWFELLPKLIIQLIEISDNKEQALQRDFTKILLLAWLFSLREEIIQTFPHEDIGRYPDTFDGHNSIEMYQQRSLDLDKLINRVSEGCSKIDNMLDLGFVT